MILITYEFLHIGHFSRPNTDYITLIKQLVFLLLLPLLLIILKLEVIKEADEFSLSRFEHNLTGKLMHP